ncbi:GNAT family N-acetyltransferase [Bacillus solimangrovi]|uniref:GNAT family N-acetyltransferase n=1 Tax=Bacillus solimangrovi TaxID=1305675 RepID=A0A1E5LE53_9BACI|nr:GNAT family N-acetyltransferase [Bacillus solimangrovi]OEH92350.1 GNAT family N-acetyltransferase [Bacillus solimangrovi]
MEAKKITTETELQKALQIREEVFVNEQGVPLEDEYDKFDDLNAPAEHVIVYHNSSPVGTGRIRYVEGVGKLERICILKPYRSMGIGKVIINALEEIAKEKEIPRVKLHGQTQAEGFYHKLGFETSSEEFMEDGIPHVLMVKELTNKKH